MMLTKERLFTVASSAGAWRSRAYQLRTAAEALFKVYIRERDYELAHGHKPRAPSRLRTLNYLTVSPVILLLAGLAIENLATALWVQKHRPPRNCRLPDELQDHERNITLLKSANVQLSTQEIALIQLLQRSVVWAGRYPIPKRAQHMELPTDFGREVFQRFKELFDRLSKAHVALVS